MKERKLAVWKRILLCVALLLVIGVAVGTIVATLGSREAPETTAATESDGETTVPDTTDGETTMFDTADADTTISDTTESETTEPRTTEPPATEPETTEPPVTEPETTEPPVTEPKTTEPSVTEPETTEPPATELETTEPPATESETTEPPATEPETTESPVTECPHSYSESVLSATCTEDGSRVFTCSACGDSYTEAIPAMGHDTKTETVAATCTAKGKKVTTCSRCDYTKTETLKALGHKLKTTTTAATCTKDGKKETACDNCGDSTTETIPAIGHDYHDTVTVATCTKRGKTVSTCSVCGDTKTAYTGVLGHDVKDYACQRSGCDYDTIYYAADFGAVGDGVTDDGPAICRAVNAVKSAKGKLIFESGKTYYIGTSSNANGSFVTPFAFDSNTGITVDGMGSTFLVAPTITYMVVSSSSDMTFINCNFDQAVPVYLVGTVTAVNGKKVTFTTDLEPYADSYDYSGITAFSMEKTASGLQQRPHKFITAMTKTASKTVEVTYTTSSTGYKVGEQAYLPNPGVGHVGSEAFYIGHNTGTVTFENVEVRAARIFVFSVKSNKGDVHFRNVDLVVGDGNTRALKLVAWRDGFHCKDNRGKLHFSHCEAGILFDDVFNISNTLGSFVSISSSTQFVCRNYEFKVNGREVAFDCQAGDVLDFYDQDNGTYHGSATVKSATRSGGTTVVTLDPNGCTVDVTKVSLTTCRIANRNTCAPGSTITDSSFEGTFRFRAPMTVRNTEFRLLTMWIMTEGGVEGLIPRDIHFYNCTFRYGYIQIDARNRELSDKPYWPEIAAQIRGIRAYDCTFADGCYLKTRTGCYIEEYKNGVLQMDAALLRPSSYVTRTDYKMLTPEELSEGHTFDFSEGNALSVTTKPSTGYTAIDQYTTLDHVHEAAAASMRANGFGETVYFYNQKSYLHSLTGAVQYGRTYRLTMTVYDCAGNLTTSGERGAFVLLKMANGTQKETEVSYTYTVDPDDSRILTLTFLFTVGYEETNDIDLYELSSSPCEFYIGSLSICEVTE